MYVIAPLPSLPVIIITQCMFSLWYFPYLCFVFWGFFSVIIGWFHFEALPVLGCSKVKIRFAVWLLQQFEFRNILHDFKKS